MFNKKKFITAASLSILLAACGGGGGGGSDDDPSSGETATDAGSNSGGSGSGGSDGSPDNGSGGDGSSGGGTTDPDATTEWTITDLDALLGDNVRPKDINNAGDLTGEIVLSSSSTATEPAQNPFIYSQGTFTQLDTLGGRYAVANSINNNGEIAGHSTLTRNGYSVLNGYVYRNGTMQNLNLADDGVSVYGMNDDGDIIGGFGDRTAFLLNDGSLETIGNLPGTSSSRALKINASGKVLGTSENPGDLSSVRTFLYANGSTQDLSSGAGCQSSSYQALNDMDQLTGLCDGRLVIRTGTSIKELGSLEGAEETEVIDMNNSGQVVGNYYVPGSNRSQIFFYDGTKLVKLGEENSISASGWTLFQAKAMNDSGQILATAFFNNDSNFRYVLLTPVKE